MPCFYSKVFAFSLTLLLGSCGSAVEDAESPTQTTSDKPQFVDVSGNNISQVYPVVMSEDSIPIEFSLDLYTPVTNSENPISWNISTQSSHGTASFKGNSSSKENIQKQSFTYTPNPNFYGNDSFVVKISTLKGTKEITIPIIVESVNDAPELISAIPDKSAAKGHLFEFQLPQSTFSDVDNDILAYQAQSKGGGELPNWLNFDTTSGKFNGTPGDGDLNTGMTIEITAEDGNGGTATDNFLLTVYVINEAPIATINTPKTDSTIVVGQSISFTGTASDPDNNLPLTYLWSFGENSGIPDSRLKSPNSITFNTPGEFTVSFTATDSKGLSDSTPETRTVTVTSLPIGISAPNFAINEETYSTAVPIYLWPAQNSAITVDYTLQNESAEAEVDFVSSSGTITFPIGATEQKIHVTVLDDTTDELDQNFLILLSNSNGALIVNNSISLTIIDNDAQPTISFSSGIRKAVEYVPDTADVNVLVRLSHKSEIEDFIVPFTVTGGTATRGQDYTIRGESVTIIKGTLHAVIPFQLLTDTEPEIKETVTINLGTPTNAAIVKPFAQTVLEIYDNSPVNDTGVTTCSNEDTNGLACIGNTGDGTGIGPTGGTDNHPGQDAHYGQNSLFLIKRDQNGNVLTNQSAEYATTPWDCVEDTITGLIWEVKTPVSSGGELRQAARRHNWLNSSGFDNVYLTSKPSSADCFNNASCDTEKYIEAVNSVGLCGYNDWRMPTKQELISIHNYSLTPTAIDLSYFPNTRLSQLSSSTTDTTSYWTSTSVLYTNFRGEAYVVNTRYGDVNHYLKTNMLYIRLVRDVK